MSKFVMYKGDKLMIGSHAYELYHDPKDIKNNRKALDEHMKKLDDAYRKLEGRK